MSSSEIPIKTTKIYEDGQIETYNNKNKLQSFNDYPSVINSQCKCWHKNGVYHRDNDKPAIICMNGNMYWLKNGNYHRDGNQPAIICSNGLKFWFEEGNLICKSNVKVDKSGSVSSNKNQYYENNNSQQRYSEINPLDDDCITKENPDTELRKSIAEILKNLKKSSADPQLELIDFISDNLW